MFFHIIIIIVTGFSPGSKKGPASNKKKSSTIKSLNAPSISKIQDYGEVKFPAKTLTSKCIECKTMMSSSDHYK